jgi:predicted RNase H-like nuclease (RuvC/YqgF family)
MPFIPEKFSFVSMIFLEERGSMPREGAGVMDEQAYQYWQGLHQRVVMGETLNAAEQAVYEAGCEELDAEERLDGNLERLRELRAQIAAAEAEQQRLRAHGAELDARITALEARLDTRTRQLLGIGN